VLLLVVPGASGANGADVEAGARRLHQVGMPAYEARQALLKGAPFTVAVDVETARGAAVELRAAGLEAFAVDEDVLMRSPPLVIAKSFRLFAEGIEVTSRPTAKAPATAHAIRWSEVEAVLPAKSVQSTFTETVTQKMKITTNPMNLMRGAKKTVDHAREVSEERFVLVLAKEPDLLVRVDEHGSEFTGLAEKKQATARANFDTFVAHVRASATTASFDNRLEKLAQKLSGSPAGVATSAATAGMRKSTSVSTTEDNEGAVVIAARWLCLAERLRRGA
jgi:hypothetical protein